MLRHRDNRSARCSSSPEPSPNTPCPAHGTSPSPYDLGDAAAAAARLLCADGAADPAQLPAAVFAYNHSAAYVSDVLAWAGRYQEAADDEAVTGPGTGLVAAPPISGRRPANEPVSNLTPL